MSAGRKHELESRECWCGPEVVQGCPECERDNPDCWRCSGRGCVAVYDEDEPVIVIHQTPPAGCIQVVLEPIEKSEEP